MGQRRSPAQVWTAEARPRWVRLLHRPRQAADLLSSALPQPEEDSLPASSPCHQDQNVQLDLASHLSLMTIDAAG